MTKQFQLLQDLPYIFAVTSSSYFRSELIHNLLCWLCRPIIQSGKMLCNWLLLRHHSMS